MTDVIASHGVQHHQYAEDTQLRLAMRADNTSDRLAVLAQCTADVRYYNRKTKTPTFSENDSVLLYDEHLPPNTMRKLHCFIAQLKY